MEAETFSTSQYHTSDKTSFAYISARDRWPVILTGAIDDVHKAVSAARDDAKIAEGKKIVETLAKLKYELQHDRSLTPLPEDGSEDIKGYNFELEKLGSVTWFNVPWLYAECYLYRRINTSFTLSQHWKSYDIFALQKISTFRSSRPAVLELCTRFREIIHSLEDSSSSKSPEASKLLFLEMCEVCLWGNATDLSLLTSLTYEDIQKLQGSEARKKAEKNIIANDLESAYDILKKGGGKGRVDIVLDNAGFELFVDLILAAYLLAAGLAENVVLHPKSLPWFVSDVLIGDFGALLGALGSPEAFYEQTEDGKPAEKLSAEETDAVQFLFGRLAGMHGEGQLVLRPNRFWTEGGSFWRLPTSAPSLYQDLKTSELVIFKGDLNYRKLTGDAAWDPTTPFTTAIGPLGPSSGVNVLALRTCKADVVVGLKQGEDERLRTTEGGGGDTGARKWAWSGKWAVCSLSVGK